VGANDQTFRLVVRPDLWGKKFRLRFSNVFGVQPLTLDDAYVGLQSSAGAVRPQQQPSVTFAGPRSVTIRPVGPPGATRRLELRQ